MRKVKVAPPFTQIAATSWTSSYRLVKGTVQPIMGTVLYGLDKRGRVWRKLGVVHCPHWHLVTDEIGTNQEQVEE